MYGRCSDLVSEVGIGTTCDESAHDRKRPTPEDRVGQRCLAVDVALVDLCSALQQFRDKFERGVLFDSDTQTRRLGIGMLSQRRRQLSSSSKRVIVPWRTK